MPYRTDSSFHIQSANFQQHELLPKEHAFCIPDVTHRSAYGANRNPQLSWKNLPDKTRSLALICHNSTYPADLRDANRIGRVIPVRADRRDFFHWVMVDIPPDLHEISAGEFSNGIIPHGKPANEFYGTRQGLNDYTSLFEGDPDMEGYYFGYDGPCLPWNDACLNRIHFTLYALRQARCPVNDFFTALDVFEAIDDQILATTSITAVYTLNPDVRPEILRDHAVVKGGQHPASFG